MIHQVFDALTVWHIDGLIADIIQPIRSERAARGREVPNHETRSAVSILHWVEFVGFSNGYEDNPYSSAAKVNSYNTAGY